MNDFYELQQILPIDKNHFSAEYTNGIITRCFIIRRGEQQMVLLNGTEEELKEYYK
ncbi:MAG: hypothetical protein GY870_06650 [archaeon]|nr:hypothetical protein [archaeon]